PSPQMVGLPLTTAIDCREAIGVIPTSIPCRMATIDFSGVSSPFGAMPAFTTALAMRQAPSKSCGTIARTAPPDTSDGMRGVSTCTTAFISGDLCLLFDSHAGNGMALCHRPFGEVEHAVFEIRVLAQEGIERVLVGNGRDHVDHAH